MRLFSDAALFLLVLLALMLVWAVWLLRNLGRPRRERVPPYIVGDVASLGTPPLEVLAGL